MSGNARARARRAVDLIGMKWKWQYSAIMKIDTMTESTANYHFWKRNTSGVEHVRKIQLTRRVIWSQCVMPRFSVSYHYCAARGIAVVRWVRCNRTAVWRHIIIVIGTCRRDSRYSQRYYRAFATRVSVANIFKSRKTGENRAIAYINNNNPRTCRKTYGLFGARDKSYYINLLWPPWCLHVSYTMYTDNNHHTSASLLF